MATSRYGPKYHRAELLRNVSLWIVDEGYMMDRKLFEMAMTILGDLRCSSLDEAGISERPKWEAITVLKSMDYKQLLLVVMSRKDLE